MTERFCGISAVLNGNVARTNEAGFSRDSRMVDDPNDDHEDEHYRVRGRFKHPVRAILDDIDHVTVQIKAKIVPAETAYCARWRTLTPHKGNDRIA